MTIIQGFSQGIDGFADGAKSQIASEIDKIAKSRSANSPKPKKTQLARKLPAPKSDNKGFGQRVGERRC